MSGESGGAGSLWAALCMPPFALRLLPLLNRLPLPPPRPNAPHARPQAVKDVYLPNSGLWVSEYPHCDRTQLLEISLAVEREAEEAAGGYGPGPEEGEEEQQGEYWGGGGGGSAQQPYGGWQQSGEWRY